MDICKIYDFNDVGINNQLMGIYCIFNTKYYYAGQSKNIRKRWLAHRASCKRNQHENTFVQNVYNKHVNDDPYKFKILELCTEAELTDREAFWVNEYGKKYNLICMNIYDPRDSVYRESDPRSKTVYQFNSSGILLNKWHGIPDASINIGVSESMISACLQKRSKHGGTFIWSYDKNINIDDYTVYRKGDEGYIPCHTKRVLQFDSKGEFIRLWNSIIDASETLGIDNGGITNVCKKRLGSAGGFIWRYEGDSVTAEDLNLVQKRIACCKYDINGVFIKKFNTCSEAAAEFGIKYQIIHNCCKTRGTYKGYFYLYENDEITIEDLWKVYKSCKTPVIKILNNGNEEYYDSGQDASLLCGINKSSITSCASGKRKTAGGYRWRKANINDWIKYKNICLN